MFYNELDRMEEMQADDYAWEKVDGQPRYRWYKNALNSVYMISCLDERFDIDNTDFSDLKLYYDSVEWVAQRDPEALAYIMNELNEPVTEIVKLKLMEGLSELTYYKSCAIVKEHLRSFPVPKERTFQRKKEKIIKEIEGNIQTNIKLASDILHDFKTKFKEKIFKTDLIDPLSHLLNIDHYWNREKIKKAILSMEWLRINAPEELEKLFSFKICLETKELLLKHIADEELYILSSFIDNLMETHEGSFYFEIPPYIPTEDDIMPPTAEWDDDDY